MDMRKFSPNLVCCLGSDYLFIDHTQPVAVLVEGQGVIQSVVDWRDLVPPVTFLIKPGEGLQATGHGMTCCPCRSMIWGVLSPWPEGANDR